MYCSRHKVSGFSRLQKIKVESIVSHIIIEVVVDTSI